jgi:hypothetical protein
MSESGDYEPAAWAPKGSFTQARQAYNQNAGRDYQKAVAAGNTASKLLPDFVETNCSHPLIVDTDFTGSMEGWDSVMASKYPYMDNEIRNEYLAKDTEISFGAHCDTSDDYPLQVRPFANGKDLLKKMDELVHASGGGGSGDMQEAHPLAWLYRTRNTRMPRTVIKPPYIMITDEMPCDMISPEIAEAQAKVIIDKHMSREEIFKEVMAIYSPYLILKPYSSERISGERLPSSTKRVFDCWAELIGPDRIAILPEAERVVDVIFGILARETGKIDYFKKEIEDRQTAKQVDTVYKALKTVHRLPKPEDKKPPAPTHSKTKGIGGGTPTKPLA